MSLDQLYNEFLVFRKDSLNEFKKLNESTIKTADDVKKQSVDTQFLIDKRQQDGKEQHDFTTSINAKTHNFIQSVTEKVADNQNSIIKLEEQLKLVGLSSYRKLVVTTFKTYSKWFYALISSLLILMFISWVLIAITEDTHTVVDPKDGCSYFVHNSKPFYFDPTDGNQYTNYSSLVMLQNIKTFPSVSDFFTALTFLSATLECVERRSDFILVHLTYWENVYAQIADITITKTTPCKNSSTFNTIYHLNDLTNTVWGGIILETPNSTGTSVNYNDGFSISLSNKYNNVASLITIAQNDALCIKTKSVPKFINNNTYIIVATILGSISSLLIPIIITIITYSAKEGDWVNTVNKIDFENTDKRDGRILIN